MLQIHSNCRKQLVANTFSIKMLLDPTNEFHCNLANILTFASPLHTERKSNFLNTMQPKLPLIYSVYSF